MSRLVDVWHYLHSVLAHLVSKVRFHVFEDSWRLDLQHAGIHLVADLFQLHTDEDAHLEDLVNAYFDVPVVENVILGDYFVHDLNLHILETIQWKPNSLIRHLHRLSHFFDVRVKILLRDATFSYAHNVRHLDLLLLVIVADCFLQWLFVVWGLEGLQIVIDGVVPWCVAFLLYAIHLS